MQTNIRDMVTPKSNIEDCHKVIAVIGLESGAIDIIPPYVLKSINSAYINVTSSLVKFKGFFNKEWKNDIHAIEFGYKKAMSKLDDIDFLTIGAKEQPVMLGLSMTVLEAAEELKKVSPDINKKLFVQLNELDLAISKFISDEEYRKSFKYNGREFERMFKETLDINKTIAKITSNGSVDAKTLKDTISNPKSAIAAAKLLIQLDKETDFSDMEKLYKISDSIASRVNYLVEVLEDNESISPEALKTLISAIGYGSNILSTYAAFFLTLRNLNLTLGHSLDIINK